MRIVGDRDLIDSSGELKSALAVILKLGFDPVDFDFEVYRLSERRPRGARSAVIRYAVAVSNRRTGRGAVLAGGHGEAWVEKLGEKLRAGQFGPPVRPPKREH